MSSNTGENLKRFIEVVGIKKVDLVATGVVTRSNLYRLFNADSVDWLDIAKIHAGLKRLYSYEIKDFFPDIPPDIENGKGVVEFSGSDRELIHKLTQDRDIWKEKYMALLEKHTQLQDMLINQVQQLMGRQEDLMTKLLDGNGHKK